MMMMMMMMMVVSVVFVSEYWLAIGLWEGSLAQHWEPTLPSWCGQRLTIAIIL